LQDNHCFPCHPYIHDISSKSNPPHCKEGTIVVLCSYSPQNFKEVTMATFETLDKASNFFIDLEGIVEPQG
jgi:hypothetical protein